MEKETDDYRKMNTHDSDDTEITSLDYRKCVDIGIYVSNIYIYIYDGDEWYSSRK